MSPSVTQVREPVSWKINRERMAILGWGTAVLLQFAHPLVAAGVAEHSTALARPMARVRRLRRTIGVMLALTFGTPAEVQRAAEGVNAIHTRVHGQLQEPTPCLPAGTPYSAQDPALLCWVGASLLYALPRAYELYIGPLTPAERDAFCAEAVGMVALLGVSLEEAPDTAAALQAYIDGMLASGEIVVGETARTLARDLQAASWPLVVRPLIWLMLLPALGLLPSAIRDAYGLPWSARHETALRLSGWLSRHLLPVLPPIVRHWSVARAAQRRGAGRQVGEVPGSPLDRHTNEASGTLV